MNEVQNNARRKVQVYACGGGGTNMAHRLESLRVSKEAGYAALDIAYIDTSKSNLRAEVSHNNVYLVKGVNGEVKDGSGSDRAENHEDIAAAIPDILLKHPPADLNIILSTLAGGTGSVVNPLLAGQFARRRVPTIVIGIGDTSTLTHARNTHRSLLSLESMAQDAEAPIVLFYLQNSPEMTRAEIDRRVKSLVALLCALFSGENRELDSKDLFNWLHYDNPRITSFRPQLTALSLLSGDETTDRGGLDYLGNVISVATVAAEGSATAFPRKPEYQCYGFFGDGFSANVAKEGPHHFVLSDGQVHAVLDDVGRELAGLEAERDARQDRRRILDGSHKPQKSGLIL